MLQNFFDINNPDIIRNVIITCVLCGGIIISAVLGIFKYLDKKRQKRRDKVMRELEELVKSTVAIMDDPQASIPQKQQAIADLEDRFVLEQDIAAKANDQAFAVDIAVRFSNVASLLESLQQVSMLAVVISQMDSKEN